jgi:hypothetical protein
VRRIGKAELRFTLRRTATGKSLVLGMTQHVPIVAAFTLLATSQAALAQTMYG